MEVIDYGPDPATIRRRLAEAEAAIERLTAERDEARAEAERARRCGVEPAIDVEDARNIARAWSARVWLSACDVGSDSAPTDAGAHTICDACERGVGPTHTDLARARSAAFLAELARRGIGDGVPIPDDVSAMEEAPKGFDEWPDPLTIEHDEDCPIRFLLEQGEELAAARGRVGRMQRWVRWAITSLRRFGIDDEAQALDIFQPGDLGTPGPGEVLSPADPAARGALHVELESLRALVEELRSEVQGAHHDARVLEEQLGRAREELVATVQLERVTAFVQPLVREWRATAQRLRQLMAASERAKADALRECADQLAVVTERFVETREAELAGYLDGEEDRP